MAAVALREPKRPGLCGTSHCRMCSVESTYWRGNWLKTVRSNLVLKTVCVNLRASQGQLAKMDFFLVIRHVIHDVIFLALAFIIITVPLLHSINSKTSFQSQNIPPIKKYSHTLSAAPAAVY